MWELFERYYGGVSREQFRADLAGKTHVILCRDGQGRIGGFSTIDVCDHSFRDQNVGVLFSGDTVIRHEYWGRNDLAFRWIRFASMVKAQRPHQPLYWLLIVKGHRTYRYLSAFGRRYYPAPDWPTPCDIRLLMESLASTRFGDAYVQDEGVIRYSTTRGYLKAPWSIVPENVRLRREVSFFLERNPGYRNGDELVCLLEVCRDNCKPMAKRVFDEVSEQVAH
jgi:hypothetical protein